MLKRNKISVLVTLLYLFSASDTYAYTQDKLWNKTIEIGEKSRELIPNKIISTTNEVDNNGKVKSSFLIDLKVSESKDHRLVFYINKATKDNKNITSEFRKEYKERQKKQQTNLTSLKDINLLFFRESQKNVTVNKTNYKESIHHKKCIIYDFSFKRNEKENYKGRAWIEDETGLPIKLNFTMDPLPKLVKKLDIVFDYKNKSDSYYFIDNIKVEASASILLFEKFYNLSVYFVDYHKIY